MAGAARSPCFHLMYFTKPRIRVVDARADARDSRIPGAVWLHVAVVAILGAVIEIVVVTSWSIDGGAEAGEAFFQAIPAAWGALFAWLPIAAGASTFLLRHAQGRELRRLATATVVLMVAVDALGPIVTVQTGRRTAMVEGEVFANVVYDSFSRESVTGTAVTLLSSRVEGVGERQSRYAEDHPRLRAGFALLKGSLLLLPALLVATCAGFLGWLDREVQFQSPGSRAQVRVWVVWILSLGLFWTATGWAERARDSAMFGSGPLTLILLPYVPLGLLAWVASRGLSRDSRPEATVAR